MASKPRILCVGSPSLRDDAVIGHLNESYEVVEVDDSVAALARLVRESFTSVLVYSEEIAEQLRVGSLLQSERILEGMPDGLVLLDDQNTIVWANDWVARWADSHHVVGRELLRTTSITLKSSARTPAPLPLQSLADGQGARHCDARTTTTFRSMQCRSRILRLVRRRP